MEALISDNSTKEGNFDTSSQSKTRAARQERDNLPTTGVPDAGTCQCDSEVALSLPANDPTPSSFRKFELHLAKLNRIYKSLEHNETALLLSLPHLRSVIDTIEGVAYQGSSSTTESTAPNAIDLEDDLLLLDFGSKPMNRKTVTQAKQSAKARKRSRND